MLKYVVNRSHENVLDNESAVNIKIKGTIINISSIVIVYTLKPTNVYKLYKSLYL